MSKDREINFQITAETKTAQDNAQQLADAFNEVQQQAISQLNEKLKETLTLTKKLRKFGGDTYTDSKNIVHTADSLARMVGEIERAKAAIEENGESLTNWASSGQKDIDKIIESYKKLAKEQEKQAAAQEKAAQKSEAALRKTGDTATRSIAELIRAAATGTLTVRGLASSFRALGAAIKAGLGPIGWAVLAIEGLIFAAQVAWGWVKKLWDDNARKAEESAKKQQRILDEAIKKADEARKKYEGFIAEQQEKDALDAIKTSFANINSELDRKVKQQKELLSLAIQEAALTLEQEELEKKLALAQLERAKVLGQVTDDEYLAEKQRIERDSFDKKQKREKSDLWDKQNAQMEEQNATRYALDTATKKRDSLASITQRSDAARDADNARLLQHEEERNALLKRRQELLERIAIAQRAALTGGAGAIAGAAYINSAQKELKSIDARIKTKEGYIDSYRDKNLAEIKALREAGYKDLARLLESQIRVGNSTVSAEVQTIKAEADKAVKDLEASVANQETEINKLAMRLNKLDEQQEVDKQTFETLQLTETDKFKKEQEEKSRKEKKQQEKDFRERQRAENKLRALMQAYSGEGAEVLSVFDDFYVEDIEYGKIEKLLPLAAKNDKLYSIVSKLLSYVSADKDITDELREYLLDQQVQLEILAEKSRGIAEQAPYRTEVGRFRKENKGLQRTDKGNAILQAVGVFEDGIISPEERATVDKLIDTANKNNNNQLKAFLEKMLNLVERQATENGELAEMISKWEVKLDKIDKKNDRRARR